MKNPLRFDQSVACSEDDRFASGPAIVFPIPPFPGLHVGALTVRDVYILQGENRAQSVTYRDVDAASMDILVTAHHWILD